MFSSLKPAEQGSPRNCSFITVSLRLLAPPFNHCRPVQSYVKPYSRDGKIVRVKQQKPFEIEFFFKALADRTRLRLLNLMGEDEVCVCYFVEVLQTNQPKISRHLAYLRKAGLVGARREAKWMHYRITPPTEAHAGTIFEKVMEWVKDDREMKKDRGRLVNLCCSPQAPIQIQGAPRPASLSMSTSTPSGG